MNSLQEPRAKDERTPEPGVKDEGTPNIEAKDEKPDEPSETRPGNLPEEGSVNEQKDHTDDQHGNDHWKPILLIGTIIVVLILSRVFGIEELLRDIDGWIHDLGPWGPVVFIIIYIIAVVVTFPASILTIAAGPLFGVFWGVIIVSIASTIGASLSFLIGRYFARDATRRWLSKTDMFQRLEMLTDEHGAFIVALVRLVPLFPFNLVNYGFGLTKVPFRTYVLYSWFCMLPFTVVFVAGAEIAMSLSHGEVPWLLILLLVIVVIILMILVKHAKEILAEKERVCMEKFGRPDC